MATKAKRKLTRCFLLFLLLLLLIIFLIVLLILLLLGSSGRKTRDGATSKLALRANMRQLAMPWGSEHKRQIPRLRFGLICAKPCDAARA